MCCNYAQNFKQLGKIKNMWYFQIFLPSHKQITLKVFHVKYHI